MLWWQSESVLFESLRRLQLMALTVDTLKVRLNPPLLIELDCYLSIYQNKGCYLSKRTGGVLIP